MILPTISLRIERWKFNKDYGVYVSTLGNFKDRHKRRLPIKVGTGGYCAVKTEAAKPWKLAHRLVMLTWKPIPDAERLTVDHLNHNKRDNSLANLEWVTESENQRRAREDCVPVEKTSKHQWKFKVNNCDVLFDNADQIWAAYKNYFGKDIRELREMQLRTIIDDIQSGKNTATVKRLGNNRHKIIITGVKVCYK